MTDTTGGRTGIEVTASHFILFIFYFFLFKPQIVVDGTATSGKWNKPTFVPATAGQHQVEIFYKYFWVLPTNKVTTTVTVPEGGVARLAYTPSIWGILGSGKVVTSPA